MRLWQFREGDAAQIIRQPGEGNAALLHEGVDATRVLFDDGREHVSIEQWPLSSTIVVGNQRGLEFLVLAGSLAFQGEKLERHCWGRLPAGQPLEAMTAAEGAQIWIKDAPLEHPDVLRMTD